MAVRKGATRLVSLSLGLTLAASLGLAACGSDDDSSDASSGGATAVGPEPTGPPIKFMIISQLTAANQADTTMSVAAAEAAAASINARGGVNGSPIRIEACDDKFNPNTATACARQAVTDDVVAVVGGISGQGDATNPILEEANIPAVGNYAISPSDFSSEIAFPLMAGAPTAIAGAARALAQAGAEKVSIVYTDISQGAASTAFVEVGLRGTGAELGAKVPVPLGSTDVAPLAAAAARDSDGIVIALQPSETIKFIQTARQAGIDLPFATPSIDADLVEKLGAAAEGLTVASLYAPLTSDVPGMKAFKADMEQFAPDAKLSDWSVGAWLAVQTVAKVIEEGQLSEIDGPSLLAELGTIKNLDMQGILPPYSTDKPASLPGLSRLFNQSIQFGKVEDGEIVPTDGKWVTPLIPATGG